MSRRSFTQEELEWIKKIDEELDALPVTLAEYDALDFIEGLLFPEKAASKEKDRARRRSYYAAHREECMEAGRIYYQEHKEEIAARKARYYLENKERILAKCREYRIRTGKTRTDEQRKADKLAHAEAAKAKRLAQYKELSAEELERKRQYQRQYQLELRAKKKGMTVEEYIADQEAKKKARDAIAASASTQEERTKLLLAARREVNRDKHREYMRVYNQKRRAQAAAAMA